MDNEKVEKNEVKHKKGDRRKITSIVIFVLGLATLVFGVVFLVLNLLKVPGTRDAEYLVEVGLWKRSDEPSVKWNFEEIGKGTLTTNSYLNEYDFIWAIEDETLKIETDWLYDIDDEYSYKIDQGSNTLTLTSEAETIVFVPAGEEADSN